MDDIQIVDALKSTYFEWEDIFAHAINKAKKNREIDSKIRSKELASFIVSVIEGGLIRSKLTGNKSDFLAPINHLEKYLYSLKVQ